MKKIICLLLLVFITNVYAQYLPIGARANSMAGAFTAVSDDATSIFWNPAGASWLKGDSWEIGHTDYVADIKMAHFCYVKSTKWITVGLGISNLYVEDWRRDEGGNILGTFVNNLTTAGLMTSIQIGRIISIGVVGKYSHEQLDTSISTDYDANIGAMINISGMSIGITRINIKDTDIFKSTEPILSPNTRLGISFSRNNQIRMSFELEIPETGSRSIGVGCEFRLWKTLYLAGGYRLKEGGYELGPYDGLNAGFSFNINDVKICYGMAPFGDFAMTHRISINKSFGTTVSNEEKKDTSEQDNIQEEFNDKY